MSNVLAAIGVAQMEVLEKRVQRRREIFALYNRELGSIEEIAFMPEVDKGKGNRWLTTLTLERTDPNRLITALEVENIESRPLWKPMHLQPLFEDAMVVEDGTSEMLYMRGVCLPSGSSMQDAEVLRVCDIIKKVVV